MANDLIHLSAGTVLTQPEFEAVGLHVLNNQATGDLIYASSATQLSRLGIGATNTLLTVIGGVPTWQSTLAGLTLTSPTINGTIATTGLTMPAFTIGSSTITGASPTFSLSGLLNIITSAANSGLVLRSTHADALGIELTIDQINDSPAIADRLGIIRFAGRDDGLAYQGYANIFSNITAVAAGVEMGSLTFQVAVNGNASTYLVLNGATATATWANCTHTGMNITSTSDLKHSGTKVIGARVVDARCDDAINSGDATTDGVIDSLRDAMIAHGLLAAA